MTPEEIINRALSQGRDRLSEHESKELLAAFGVPVCREVLARTPEEAAASAATLGFPVAVKACGAEISHKSEQSLVALSLKTEPEVREAAARLLDADGADSVIVAEMVSGSRELLLGLVRDLQFGPCVMAGAGGVLTEVLDDVAFRMAPTARPDIEDMLDSLACRPMLSAFRGQAAADRDALADVVAAIGKVAEAFPQVSEIDVNPVIITKSGQIVAVDALVVLERSAPAVAGKISGKQS
ncbi:MAG: acetate--CoA ligase family protein [Thermodesulfobacteriota bacterium]